MKTLQQQQCLSPASHAGSFCVCLNWAKRFRKILLWSIELDKIKMRSWKKQQEGLLQDVWTDIKLLQNKTSLGKNNLLQVALERCQRQRQ